MSGELWQYETPPPQYLLKKAAEGREGEGRASLNVNRRVKVVRGDDGGGGETHPTGIPSISILRDPSYYILSVSIHEVMNTSISIQWSLLFPYCFGATLLFLY